MPIQNPIVKKYLQNKYMGITDDPSGGGTVAPPEEAPPPVPEWPQDEMPEAPAPEVRQPAAAAPPPQNTPAPEIQGDGTAQDQGAPNEFDAQSIMGLINSNTQRLQDAQEEAQSKNVGVNMGRGVDTIIAGLGNVKPQSDFYTDLVKQNQNKVENLKDTNKSLGAAMLEAERLRQGGVRIGQSEQRLTNAGTVIGLRKKETEHKRETEGRERAVPGYGLAPSKKIAEEMIKASKEANDGYEAADALLKIAADPSNKLNPVKKREAAIHVAALKAGARIAVSGGGSISEYEQHLLDTIAADPTRIFSLPAGDKAALKAMQGKFLSGMKNFARAAGVVPDADVQQQGADLPVVQAANKKPPPPVGDVIVIYKGVHKKIPQSRLKEALADGATLFNGGR
jgi:hypothetical protein